jgi:hypothetical protein
MTIEDEIPQLVADVVARLGQAPEARRNAGVGAILERWFVLAGPGWARWPDWGETAAEGLEVVTARLAGVQVEDARRAAIRSRLDAFDIEDDGSDEWQYAVDLISTLDRALAGAALPELLEYAVTAYAEGTYTTIANALADANGGVTTQATANRDVPRTDEWRRARAFLDGL